MAAVVAASRHDARSTTGVVVRDVRGLTRRRRREQTLVYEWGQSSRMNFGLMCDYAKDIASNRRSGVC